MFQWLNNIVRQMFGSTACRVSVQFTDSVDSPSSSVSKPPVKSGQQTPDAPEQSSSARQTRKPKLKVVRSTTVARSRKPAKEPAQPQAKKSTVAGKPSKTPASKTRQHAKRQPKPKA